jgi:hypothetical protein
MAATSFGLARIRASNCLIDSSRAASGLAGVTGFGAVAGVAIFSSGIDSGFAGAGGGET